MPPPYSKGGYSQVPQTDNCEDYYRSDPPYSAPAPVAPAQPTWGPPGYAPAPPVLQQQSSNTVCLNNIILCMGNVNYATVVTEQLVITAKYSWC